MGIIFLAVITILVRAYPENLPWDDSAGESSEELFPTSSLNIFDDTLASSASNFFNDLAFLDGYSPEDDYTTVTDPSLADLDGEPVEDSFANYNLDFKEGGVSTSNLDLSLVDANCGDFSAQTEDPLFDDYAIDPSTNIFPSAVNAEDPFLLINDNRISLENKGIRKQQYVRERTYDLDPSTGPYILESEPYAEDGTPLRLGRCPPGKKRTCCMPDDPPFRECWLAPITTVCRFAKNNYCCTGVQIDGGPGIDCERGKWVKSRTREREEKNSSRDPQQSPLESPPLSNQLQESFPILQDLPDINSPAYCRPETRRRI